jgi:thiol-disulfide isomerase/thioredoxin
LAARAEQPITAVGPPRPGTVLAAGEVSLRAVDADTFRDAIDQHKGRVILVDFWATWCGPCKEDFPHSVELSRRFKEQGLQVVSVSFDDPKDYPAVLAFLREQGATIENLVSVNGMSIESISAFDIVGGALPFYKLYDRTGALRYQFTGDPEGLEGVLKTGELDKRVQELIEGA